MRNANRTPLIHSRLDPASQRLLVEAVLVEARRMRSEAIRDWLRRAASFVYRTRLCENALSNIYSPHRCAGSSDEAFHRRRRPKPEHVVARMP